MRYLILHGWQGSPDPHWQSWLAGRLQTAGHDVAFPVLPDPAPPDLEAWLAALAPLRAPGQVVVAHSAGCALWLHHRARGGAPADRVLLVAPPWPEPMIDELASFYPVPLERGLVPEARIAASVGDDPYCPAGAAARFAEPLGIPIDVLDGAGHVNTDAGFGPWPAALRWAYGENQGIDT